MNLLIFAVPQNFWLVLQMQANRAVPLRFVTNKLCLSNLVLSLDTKLLKIVKSTADCKELHRDLTKLGDWAAEWQMKFTKCK